MLKIIFEALTIYLFNFQWFAFFILTCQFCYSICGIVTGFVTIIEHYLHISISRNGKTKVEWLNAAEYLRNQGRRRIKQQGGEVFWWNIMRRV